MKRIPEPELMDTEEQARAYAAADFSSAHQSYVVRFDEAFPDRPRKAVVLDLGCGAADVTMRFARANPGYRFHAVDGSAAMLKYARTALRGRPAIATRIKLIRGYVPKVRLPRMNYDVILCSSFLHHLHEPRGLWQTVRGYAKSGAIIFVADLFRPPTRAEAAALVRKYSRDEPPVLRRDFHNSLLAAFTPGEVEKQLADAGLNHLRVQVISDRHLIVFGKMM